MAEQFSANTENRGVVVTEAGSYLRLLDFCIIQLQAQGPSRFFNESKEEKEGLAEHFRVVMLGVRYTPINVEAKNGRESLTKWVRPNMLIQS